MFLAVQEPASNRNNLLPQTAIADDLFQQQPPRE
jgi:hypothetical protein